MITFGILILLAAGISDGSFYLPTKYTKKWQWEHTWLIFSFSSMIVINWLYTFIFIPDVFEIFAAISTTQLVILIILGALWGVGAILFGTANHLLGMALAYPLGLGMVACCGTLVPLLIFYPEKILTMTGLIVFAGIAILVFGVIVSSRAFKCKEDAAAETETGKRSVPLVVGLLVAIFAGVFSAFINIGFSYGEVVKVQAMELGVKEIFAGNALWSLFFTVAFVINAIYCLILMVKNNTLKDFWNPHIVRNLGMGSAMGALFMTAIYIYGIGATCLGEGGSVPGWIIFMSVDITTGNIWGLVTGEWQAAPKRARRLLTVGTIIILIAVAIVSVSEMVKTETASETPPAETLRQSESVSKSLNPQAAPNKWYNSLKPKGIDTSVLAIAEGGKSNYSIVLSGQATTQDKKAAQELQYWLEKMTTVKLPIVTEGSALKDKSQIISLGYTRQLQDANLSAVKEDLEDEGYGIAVQDKKLFLWGGRTRGVINAVFALLEEDLGCRWYTDEAIMIPKNPTLKFTPVSRTYIPVLKLRDPYYFVAFNGTWSLRNRTNAPGAKVPEEWGGYMEYCNGDSTDHSSMFVHTFHDLLSPDEYYEKHPEYFMLDEDGNRDTHQLCTTHPEVVRIVIDSVKRYLRANPNARIISVSKMDGGGTCLCSKCRALDEAEGTHMASLLYLVNGVAEAIEEEFPHVTVSTLAYLETVKPPRTIRPRKNVAIRLCSDDVGAWLRPFEPSRVCQFGQLVKAWSAVHDRIHIWHYTVNFSHYLAPMPNMENIAEDIGFLVDNHAEGIMTQGAFQSVGERDWLRSWVFAKLMWDPYLDLDELMHDFIYGYFGKSAPAIAEYNALLRNQLVVNRDIMTVPHLAGPDESIRYPMDHPFLSKEFLAKATELYDRAEKLAENERVLRRVQRDRLPIMYVKLARGPEFVGNEYGKILERFEKIARREGVTRLREGSPDLDEKLEGWRNQWVSYQK
ncbi:MAG: DUF4838 domain-containing protein [Planctomycetes bacterium]|nr:DUF4838 domain-containing protein [Planctomycetota bacterium]